MFFGRSAEVANQYLRKGSKVQLDGRIKLDQWTDKQGQKRSKHSVSVENLTMLDSKPSYGQSTAPSPQPHQTPTQEQYNVGVFDDVKSISEKYQCWEYVL
ncbi:MAG: single-stranded DNA-binding protein [Sulfurovum sp.]|nr:single-stranded DNA-binding protein [Sulfurovum sp.]